MAYIQWSWDIRTFIAYCRRKNTKVEGDKDYSGLTMFILHIHPKHSNLWEGPENMPFAKALWITFKWEHRFLVNILR